MYLNTDDFIILKAFFNTLFVEIIIFFPELNQESFRWQGWTLYLLWLKVAISIGFRQCAVEYVWANIEVAGFKVA